MYINLERYVGYVLGTHPSMVQLVLRRQDGQTVSHFSLQGFLLYFMLKMTCAINLVLPAFPVAWLLQSCQGDVVWLSSVWETQVTHCTERVQGCWLFCLAILPCPVGLACPHCSEHSYWTWPYKSFCSTLPNWASEGTSWWGSSGHPQNQKMYKMRIFLNEEGGV